MILCSSTSLPATLDPQAFPPFQEMQEELDEMQRYRESLQVGGCGGDVGEMWGVILSTFMGVNPKIRGKPPKSMEF